MSKGLKYMLIIITGFVLLIATLLLLTQTSFFREKAKIQLVQYVEDQLDVSLEIEKIEGNIYNKIIINNIRFSENDSTVATFASLQINYHLLPLFSDVIRVDSLIVQKPELNLWQNNDSTWNLSGYIKFKDKPVKKENKKFRFAVHAGYVALREGNISISSFSKVIPQKTKDFNLTANGTFQNKSVNVHLNKLDFETQNPSLVLKKLSGIYNMDPDGIQVDSFQLITESSNVNFDGDFASIENLNSTIDAERVSKKELALFIPSLKLLCSPSISAQFSTVNDTVVARTELQYNNQSVYAEISLNTFSRLLNKSGPVSYFAHLTFDNFTVEDWIGLEKQNALIFGEIQMDGTNLLDFQSPTSISADLHDSRYNNVLFDTLLFKGNFMNDSLSALLNLRTDFGDIEINGELWSISEIPEYDVEIETNKFNVTAFIPKLEGTKLNGTIAARGKGFQTEDLCTNGTVYFNNSTIYNFPIDTLKSKLEFQNSALNIDTLLLQVPGANATASGVLNLDSLYLESLIFMDIDSLTVINSIAVLPIAFDSASTVSTITGPVKELKIGGDVEVFNTTAYSSRLGKTDATYLVSVKTDSLLVEVETKSSRVEYLGTKWDSLNVDLSIFNKKLDIFANVIWQDTIDAKFNSTIKLGDTLSVVIPNLEIKTLLSNYYLADTVKTNILKTNNLEIQNFKLKDQNRPDFIVSADGTISMDSINNFVLHVNQLDLMPFNRFFQKQDSLKGILDTELSIAGTARNPEIKGTISIRNPQFGSYGLSSLNTTFDYADQNGFAEVTTPDLGDAFYASISAPFEAYFDSLNFVFSQPDTFNAQLLLDSLPVSESMQNLVPNDSINGVLHANIKASGEFNNPLFYGNLDLINGHFENKNLGINYDQIKTSTVFDGKKITLDTVYVKQKGGLISVTGEVEFDSTIVKGNIISSSIQANADKFFITQHRNYEILIDANTFIKTGAKNPEFGGNIRVARSDVYLPALIPDNNGDMQNNTPMLVEALYVESDSSQYVDVKKNIDLKKNAKQSVLLDNLTGRLRVEIPRNTWIKSDDMRLELSGDVDIAKTGPYFELFGNIDIIRGHYILYGKKLNIKESQIIFQGGEEMDPNLSFLAEYVYRDNEKQKRFLELVVTGKVSDPEITFLLDGTEIPETDGVSILIFGATSDEIGYGGQNGIINSVSSNAVASVITSQLSRTIGTQFNLDMIEVTATDNWQSAAFVVGKYITNDIFVMYERGFGEVDGDEITPETITVEYEINKKLFFRLQSGSSITSGVDVILKFEQEKENNASYKKRK